MNALATYWNNFGDRLTADDRARARILAISCVAAVPAFLVTAWVFALDGVNAYAILNLVLAVVTVAAIPVASTGRLLGMTLNVLLGVALSILVAASWAMGGFVPEQLVWLFVIPVLAILMRKRRMAIFAQFASVVAFVGLYAADQIVDPAPIMALSDSGMRFYAFSTVFICSVLVVFLTSQGRTSLATASTAASQLRARLGRRERLESMGLMSAQVVGEVKPACAELQQGLEELHGLLDDEELVSCIEDAQNGVARISDLVASLSTFAAQSRGNGTTRIVLADAVELALTLTENELRHKATIVQTGDLSSPVLASELLPQVFVALLSNAASAIPLGDPADNEVRIDARRRGDAIWVSVADTGTGLAAEAIPHIFDPFYSTSWEFQNMGLGLSVARGIVHSFGGQLFVDEESEDTTFVLVLPAG